MAPKKRKRNKVTRSTLQTRPGYLTYTAVTVVFVCAAAVLVAVTIDWSSNSVTAESGSSEMKRTANPSKRRPNIDPVKLLERVSMQALKGNLEAVKSLIEGNPEVDWNAALNGVQMTPVHYALQGRYDSILQQSTNLIGQHEDVITYLIKDVRLNASVGCPVYYAMHYRNVNALRSLLRFADIESSVACLTSLDSTGETALHSAVKSKASGFARFFVRLMWRKPEPAVMDLLGLRPLKVPDSQIMTLKVLNSAITHEDFLLVLEYLQSAFNASSVLDFQGNTLLHNAVYGGRSDLVRILLDQGVPVDSVNHLGVTPLHLAYASGFCEIAAILIHHGARIELKDQIGRVPGDITSYRSNQCYNSNSAYTSESKLANMYATKSHEIDLSLWRKYIESGWVSDLDHATHVQNESMFHCEIDIRDSASLTKEDFLAHYKAIYKPVIVRGLTKNWPAWEHWTVEQLQQRYGHLKFTISNIPYAELYFGENAKTTQVSLTEYVSSFRKAQKYPNYIFDGQVLYWNSKLVQDAPIPGLFGNFSIVLKQFIVGPGGSGSPPHFHRHAFNALIYGLKHWYLWPPRDAYFTFSHIHNWQKVYLEETHNEAIECIQRPGDVLYVPENWGHAVINLEASIGVAYEFV